MDDLVFLWDPAKAEANLAKHGVSFQIAMQVFHDPRAVSVIDRVVEGEERWRTVGRVGSATVLFVAHTWIDDAGSTWVRIITARRATKREVKAYDAGDEDHFR